MRGLSIIAAVSLVASAAAAQPSPETASRGLEVYVSRCAICHAAELSGGPSAPALKGPEFDFQWKARSAQELSTYVRSSMPPGQVGQLSSEDYDAVVALILRVNGREAQP